MTVPCAEFGLGRDPVEIPGGVSGVLRCGDVVVKQVSDVAEAEWTQATFAALAPSPAVRWAKPLAARDGRWVVDGWIANEFIPDLTPVAPDWSAVIEFGERFHAATHAVPPPVDMLRARTHRWARGERHAFEEETVELPQDVATIYTELAQYCVPDHGLAQVVHVDLATNVFVDPDGVPVILDLAPGFRSHSYCSAVAAADALVWSGADLGIIDLLGPPETARPLLARAFRFRIVTDHIARSERGDATTDQSLAPYRELVAAVADTAGHRTSPVTS
jgi:uncharacterized protein (TIGR02569 family)